MLLASLAAVSAPAIQDNKSTCLAFVTTELAKGIGNFFSYYTFSEQRVEIKDGDVLVYSIFLDPANPSPKGGIDASFTDGGVELRDGGYRDQNGISAHGDGLLEPAKGKWYTRQIPISRAKGRIVRSWQIQCEGDEAGRYAQFIDDLYIQRADGSKVVIYADGGAPVRAMQGKNGYTQDPSCVAIRRDRVTEGANIAPVIEQVVTLGKRLKTLDKVRSDIALAQKFVDRNPDPALVQHIKEANAMLQQVEREDSTPEEVQAALHAANHALSHTHPVMTQYTGHLVGHAHIDLQWLWEWQEGIIATRDTFNQATKFMDEFPGFTFSQSSSVLYKTTEEDYPQIFKKIQQKVKKGQWEIVGGRVCEGDTNMISPESQARQFLYGQMYFREKFGKTARVGWEPDTFGHSLQMPQILKLGGIDSYYFCRGGKGKPLFYWQGLDGTKMLSFEEPATGSWYNSDLSYSQFQEMLDFEKTGNSKDALMVYGIGNHGGGPSREYIETALSWMKDPSKPKIKFSTATQFFDKLKTYDLSKIPVVKQELNPVFDGCYTTHSEVKQLNRQAEYATSSAEATSAVASLFGFKYPRAAFRSSWEDICYNHHHDTLPGSGIHAGYEKTKIQLSHVIAEDKEITLRALETMSLRVTPEKDGISIMVFNPTGWTRSAWVETLAVTSGGGNVAGDNDRVVSVGPNGKENRVELLDRVSRRSRFFAENVPAFGYRVFHIKQSNTKEDAPNYGPLENEFIKAELDPATGGLKSVIEKKTGRDLVKPGGQAGRLEQHYEEPNGMSAWVIGAIKRTETLKPTSQPSATSFEYRIPAWNQPGKETVVRQTYSLLPGSHQIDVRVDCDWQHVGSGDRPHPLLRVAFDANTMAGKATYEIPFGSLVRPTDGQESAALNWADVSDSKGGLAVLNDAKSGHSTNGSTLRVTLIRSSFTPDPNPNPGQHTWHYAIVPHGPEVNPAKLSKMGIELQQPLLPITVPFEARGAAPLEFSALSVSDANIVPTGLKLAELSNDFVLRSFEAGGKPSTGTLNLGFKAKNLRTVNFLEDFLGIEQGFTFRPFEIKTLRFTPESALVRF